MLSKDFLTAGKAIFTLEVPQSFQKQYQTNPHYTFRVSKSDKPFYFVGVLTGPDNTKHYSYLGLLFPEKLPNKRFTLTEKSKFNLNSWQYRFFNRIAHNLDSIQIIENVGFIIHHEGFCGRCGRPLTVPESVKTGIGPECSKRIK